MSDVPGTADDLADIHAAFAIDVLFTGGALTAAPITAIPSDMPADPFQGGGQTARMQQFEIRKADVPAKPVQGDEIEEADSGQIWTVIEAADRRDVDAWQVTVEEAQ